MGRKMKGRRIFLIGLAALFCLRSPLFGHTAGAGEEAAEEEENKEEGKEGETEAAYEIEESLLDGENGYYKSCPKVRIVHKGGEGRIQYCFTDAGGRKLEGELTEEGEEAVIGEEQFMQGENILEIWKEEKEREKRSYKVDSVPPQIFAAAPRGFDAWYEKEAVVSARAKDEGGSGIAEIAGYCGDRKIAGYEKEAGIFAVREASVLGGPLRLVFRARDKAGNTAEIERRLYIDALAPKLSLQGIEDYGITGGTVRIAIEAREENVMERCEAKVFWEKETGEKEELPLQEWTGDGGKRSLERVFEEDGIYKIEANVWDGAGQQSTQRLQFIIDRHNPIISKVDEINGKYMKEFSLEYSASEIVKDFTSYTCEIRLDGLPYAAGTRVAEEGVHTLSVRAQDMAGNISRAGARFVVDNTRPVILTEGLEDGKAYEEELDCRIYTAEKTDEIKKAAVNGKSQRLEKGGKGCRLRLKGEGEYEVLIQAQDMAGNKNEEKFLVEITKKQTALRKMLEPVSGVFSPKAPKGGKKEERKETGARKKSVGKPAAGAALALVAVGAGFWLRKREN